MNPQASTETSACIDTIFLALQRLLEMHAPEIRQDAPERFDTILAMVASREASFGAKVATSPGMVTLTIHLPTGEFDLATFMYSQAGGVN